jgi:hypothetical protein
MRHDPRRPVQKPFHGNGRRYGAWRRIPGHSSIGNR